MAEHRVTTTIDAVVEEEDMVVDAAAAVEDTTTATVTMDTAEAEVKVSSHSILWDNQLSIN